MSKPPPGLRITMLVSVQSHHFHSLVMLMHSCNLCFAAVPNEHKHDYKIHLNNEYGQWFQAEPTTLSFTWNPMDIMDRRYNHTNKTDPTIVAMRIFIVAYYEWKEPVEDDKVEIKVDSQQASTAYLVISFV